MISSQTVFAEFPELVAKSVRLRKLRLTDRADYFELESDPEVAHYHDWQPCVSIDAAQRNIRSALRLFEHGIAIKWGIELRATRKLVGHCALRIYDEHDKAEISYCVNRNHWGHGYAGQSISTMAQYAFNTIALHRLEAYVSTTNSRSIRLLQSTGFEQEGTLKDFYKWKNQYHTMHVFARTAGQ